MPLLLSRRSNSCRDLTLLDGTLLTRSGLRAGAVIAGGTAIGAAWRVGSRGWRRIGARLYELDVQCIDGPQGAGMRLPVQRFEWQSRYKAGSYELEYAMGIEVLD